MPLTNTDKSRDAPPFAFRRLRWRRLMRCGGEDDLKFLPLYAGISRRRQRRLEPAAATLLPIEAGGASTLARAVAYWFG